MARLAAAVALTLLALAAGAEGARQKLAPKPDVGPIIANFIPTDLATYYGINASEPPGAKPKKLSVVWSLTPPPNNKSCKDFGRAENSPKIAVWNHGDGDGCNHVHIGADGHLGIVKVTVRDAAYECTATYLGTASGIGDDPVCITVQRSNATRDLEIAIAHEEAALARLTKGRSATSQLRASASWLDRVAGDLRTLDVQAAATAATHLRRAISLDKLALETPSQARSQVVKALAENHKAEALIQKLP